YAEDAEVFGWIRRGAPPGRVCLEGQVMDWADDVAYSVHDLEDGLHAGLITMAGLRDRGQREAVTELTLASYCDPASVTAAELGAAIEAGAPQALDPVLRPAWEVADSARARRRVVIDQVASLTDTSAQAWHRRLCR